MKTPEILYLRPEHTNVFDPLPLPSARFAGDVWLIVGDPKNPKIEHCALVVAIQKKDKRGAPLFGSLELAVKTGPDVDAFGFLIADLERRLSVVESRVMPSLTEAAS